MKAKVIYSHNPKWFLANETNIPCLVDVWVDYGLVAEFELPKLATDEWKWLDAADWVFSELNLNPEKWIPELPEQASHTSMSVGDIVYLENDKERHVYICIAIGGKNYIKGVG